jgi:lysyl-tRNA synthetase, class II
MPTLDELIQIRKDKLEILREQGINPYPSVIRREHSIHQARSMEGRKAEIAGRILSLRGHGKIYFMDVADGSGKIQIVVKVDAVAPEILKLLGNLDIADFVSVQGMVGKTQAGELSVFAEDLQIITKTLRPLPDSWYGFKDVEDRFRKRYLDTILNPEVKARLTARSKTIDSIRDFLTDRNFLEVETPTLQPIYGGGFARPFKTHHNELDGDFYLRISDEMYLKRLIVGGFDKVFEITKVFRNEGVDHDHNPEFTMFEAQIAYENYSYGMDLIEEIIESAALRVVGKSTVPYQGIELDFTRPWKRYSVTDAIKKYLAVDPLTWKSVDEAKEIIQRISGIKGEKFSELSKMSSIGECIAFAFEEGVEEKLIQPTIIYDYPVEISPLAKKCADPRFTQRFEMFAFGSELGNNYTELNDPIDLRQRFVDEKNREAAGFDEAHQTDHDYLEAIEHGFPPTCGIAIGIDRLVMLLTDAKSIKEVIPFPTLRPQKNSDKTSASKSKTAKPEKYDPKHLITKDQAKEILHRNTQNLNLRRHMYAVGFAMRALAEKLGGDPEVWEVLGLLHDADWELTKETPDQHTVRTLTWLKEMGITEGPLVHALMSHNSRHTHLSELEGIMEWSLETVDELTGFIVAVTLIRPEKKLASVTVESVMKKWKSKEFAAAVDRSQISQCEEKLGIPLPEFIAVTLSAMQVRASELGL